MRIRVWAYSCCISIMTLVIPPIFIRNNSLHNLIVISRLNEFLTLFIAYQLYHTCRHCTYPCKKNHQLLKSLWHSNFHCWHKAEKVTELKVCCERTAGIANSILYESTGSRSQYRPASSELTQLRNTAVYQDHLRLRRPCCRSVCRQQTPPSHSFHHAHRLQNAWRAPPASSSKPPGTTLNE